MYLDDLFVMGLLLYLRMTRCISMDLLIISCELQVNALFIKN